MKITDSLDLSYRSVQELNHFIDTELHGRPPFIRKELNIGHERLDFYCRDVIECIRSLYGDPHFAKNLAFAPERHYTSPDRRCRIYNEMYTSDWWWSVQVRMCVISLRICTDKHDQTTLEAHRPGATIIPVILSSDKTRLTMFRDKMAYPVYLTIGNIPKDIRRKPSHHAQILIGYIPTTKLSSITNKVGRRRALANLFHACMLNVLGPISSYGETGIAMRSGDGVWRRCHPILAVFVGDYPEQTLVTCTYSGRCPKCTIPPGQLGKYEKFPSRMQSGVIDIYALADGDPSVFHLACREAGVKPVYRPFWECLPLVNIYLSITPDILHQMLQGMIKHLIRWLVSVFGAAEIDARCKAIPPNHRIMIFTRGISTLSRVSGHEHKKMCSILLGLIVDLPIPGGQNPSRVVKAVRALLDFLFVAQYECHTAHTLSRLDDILSAFHDNKQVFVDLGVREHFNLPKLHSLIHYTSSIRLFGTTDNYNTEQSERLHIDFAKDAYRATNKRDEYAQMTVWLERCEKMQQHAASIEQRQQNHQQSLLSRALLEPPRACAQRIKMAQHPSVKAVSFREIPSRYGAHLFQDALADFITQLNNPGIGGNALHRLSANTLLPFRTVAAYHNIKFTGSSGLEIIDSVHARPEQKDLRGRIIPSRFDTVLVRGRGQDSEGIGGMFVSCDYWDLINWHTGHRIAQVRMVFQIPQRYVKEILSTDAMPPTHLAYVEWFTPLPVVPEPKHLMYKVSRMMSHGRRCADIIPVESILCSVHLIPQFGPVMSREWSSFTVLDQCHTFYVNPFTDIRSYLRFV
jgi:hypothetical protein